MKKILEDPVQPISINRVDAPPCTPAWLRDYLLSGRNLPKATPSGDLSLHSLPPSKAEILMRYSQDQVALTQD